MSKPSNEEEAKQYILNWCKENKIQCCWCYPCDTDKIVKLEIKRGFVRIHKRLKREYVKEMKYCELLKTLKAGLKKIKAIEEAIEREKAGGADV